MRMLLRCWVGLLLSAAITVYSAPLAQQDDGVVVNTHGTSKSTTWQPEPKVRGTFQIIFSCILTLFLCVWTTVHVNIEPIVTTERKEEDSKSRKLLSMVDDFLAKRFVRKIGWSITSLFVPEATMAVAAWERKTASLLRKEMQKQRKLSLKNIVSENTSTDPKKNEAADISTYPEKDKATDASAASKKDEVADIIELKKDEATDNASGLKKNGVAGASMDLEKGGEAGASESSSKGISKDINPWDDLSLSYYAVMGGFRVIYGPPDAIAALSPGSQLVGMGLVTGIIQGRKKEPYVWSEGEAIIKSGTLTPHGVLFMADNGWLPDISAEIVKDKSKVNALAKVLVCFQAAWIIIQVIARTAAGQQVTLVEVHTVLQTLCAATMYITWWDKPADIEFPTEIILSKEQFDKLREAGEEINPTNPFTRDYRKKNIDRSNNSRVVGTPDKKYVTSRAGLGKLMYQQLCGEKGSEGHLVAWYFETIARAFSRIIHAKMNIWKEGLFLCAVGLAYGGGHLSTWNNYFPSKVEMYLWKVCSIVTAVAVCGFVFLLYFGAFLHMILKLDENREGDTTHNADNRWDRIIWRAFKGFFGITFGVGIFIVLVARLYLLVGSFIALRKVMISSYNTVEWTEAWPHLG